MWTRLETCSAAAAETTGWQLCESILGLGLEERYRGKCDADPDSLSEVGDSDTGCEVEETLSVGGDELHAFTLDDDMVPQPAETAADVLAAKVGPLGGSPHWGGHVGVGGVLLEGWLGSAVGSGDERASGSKG
jgi:hypothetical protein